MIFLLFFYALRISFSVCFLICFAIINVQSSFSFPERGTIEKVDREQCVAPLPILSPFFVLHLTREHSFSLCRDREMIKASIFVLVELSHSLRLFSSMPHFTPLWYIPRRYIQHQVVIVTKQHTVGLSTFVFAPVNFYGNKSPTEVVFFSPDFSDIFKVLILPSATSQLFPYLPQR